MKRIVTLILALTLLCCSILTFTACSKDDNEDWKQIEEKGYFVCGITVYEPMNYFDDSGNLIGFDTEVAQAVAEYLGVEVKFQIIDWPSKYLELNSGSIDCIWNGFTYGLEDGVSRAEYVDFTYSYLENKQCVVTRADRLGELNSAEAFAGKKAAVEGGSSGEGVAETLTSEDKIATYGSQMEALMDLNLGKVDFIVIDYQMAKEYAGSESYAALAINNAIQPESEVYAIGCRKGSDFTGKLNEALAALSANGKLAEIAAKYNLTNDLIPNLGQ